MVIAQARMSRTKIALVREIKGGSPMNHISRPVDIITTTAPAIQPARRAHQRPLPAPVRRVRRPHRARAPELSSRRATTAGCADGGRAANYVWSRDATDSDLRGPREVPYDLDRAASRAPSETVTGLAPARSHLSRW